MTPRIFVLCGQAAGSVQSGVGDFNNEKDVFSPDFLRSVIVGSWLQQENIGFGLAIIVQLNRILNAHDWPVGRTAKVPV